jgi:glycosyltransferase involved in cell wall biosynthesis
MLSIIIPSWNNKEYLECCIHSILQNSKYKHQIVVHINEGADGSLEILKQLNITYTYSNTNIGVCKAINKAYSLCTNQYIMYMNDDMYVSKNWDEPLINYIQKLAPNIPFMLSATMVEPSNTNNSCVLVNNFGNKPTNFKQIEFEIFASNTIKANWSGSFWPPNIVPKFLWEKVNGFNEAYSPGMSSDDAFVHDCWNAGCRIFVGLGNSLVYHFQGKSTGRIVKNNGRKQYLLQYGITQGDFRKHYLKLGKECLNNNNLLTPNWFIIKLLKLKGFLKLLLQ